VIGKLNKKAVVAWFVMCALHIALIDSPTTFAAPAVAGSIYLPLFFLQTIGFPVYAAGTSGGWSAPSLLGWLFLAVLWASVWWLVACVLAKLFKRG
jgi:hypothetical protein